MVMWLLEKSLCSQLAPLLPGIRRSDLDTYLHQTNSRTSLFTASEPVQNMS